MRFEVLGPMRVSLDAADITPQGGLQRLLLALLLARGHRGVSVDVLTQALWGDPPDAHAPARLQLLVHRLRTRLGAADRISLGPQGYELHLEENESDAERFRTSADVLLHASDPAAAVAHARDALACWRGRPFAELDHPILDEERHQLTEQRLGVQEQLFDAELALGQHLAILPELEELARAHLLNEHVQGMLLTALYRCGRQAEALQVYRRTREVLVQELGLEPGPELRRLHQGVLGGDPAAAPRIRVVPAQLPRGSGELFGRETDLGTLDALFEARSPRAGKPTGCTVTGTAGVGKTALAIAWARGRRLDFPDGQLYADLCGYSADAPLEPGSVLASFIRAIGGGTTDLAAMDVGERAALFRSLVDGQRMLIVLDNARSAAQVRELLPGTGGCFVLVTSRDSLPELAVHYGTDSLHLERLGHNASLELLVGVAGEQVHGDAGAASALVEACARLPIALRLAGEQVRSRPGSNLGVLVREIRQERSRLDHLELGTGPQTDMRAVFSWSYGTLPADAARLFAHLGLLPGPDADAETISALAGIDLRVARRLLKTLVGANLVERTAQGRFRLHGLLREYTLELALRSFAVAERETAISRLIDYYGSVTSLAIDMAGPAGGNLPGTPAAARQTELDSSVAWLEAERPSFEALAGSADTGNGHRLVELSQSLELFLWTQSHGVEAQRLQEENRDRARRARDPAAEVHAEQLLGSLCRDRGDLEGAEAHHRRALELSGQTHDRLGASLALHDLGIAADASGRTGEGLALLSRALELVRAEHDEARTAIALGNIGELQGRLGRDTQAGTSYGEALEISLVHGFRRTLQLALRGLTRLAIGRGAYDEALSLAQQSLDQGRLEASQVAEARAHGTLGRIYALTGNARQARRHHDAALAQARCTGNLDLLLEQLRGRAELVASTDPHTSRTHYLEAIDLARSHHCPAREAELRRALAGLRTDPAVHVLPGAPARSPAKPAR